MAVEVDLFVWASFRSFSPFLPPPPPEKKRGCIWFVRSSSSQLQEEDTFKCDAKRRRAKNEEVCSGLKSSTPFSEMLSSDG